MKVSQIVTLFFMLIPFFSVGCGGGGADGDSDTSGNTISAAMFRIGGAISGLTGTVEISNGGASSLRISQNGLFSFSQTYPDTTCYDIRITQQPEGEFCTLVNGSSAVNGEDVSSIGITCVRSATMNLVWGKLRFQSKKFGSFWELCISGRLTVRQWRASAMGHIRAFRYSFPEKFSLS